MAREESRAACAPLLALHRELAAAEAAERLESQVVAGRTQLATVAVAGTLADPQAGALARLTGLDEATIRVGVALLLAGLIEAGSALGFTLVSASTTLNPPQPGAGRVPSPQKVASRDPNPAPKPPAQAFERWVKTQLTANPASQVAAREAYAEFCRWSHAAGLAPCSETRFGRQLTAHINGLGGHKAKRRDRGYYVGVSLVQCLAHTLTFDPTSDIGASHEYFRFCPIKQTLPATSRPPPHPPPRTAPNTPDAPRGACPCRSSPAWHGARPRRGPTSCPVTGHRQRGWRLGPSAVCVLTWCSWSCFPARVWRHAQRRDRRDQIDERA